MISADRFLSLLEEKDLIPSAVVAKLRQQVAQAKSTPKASNVAKALIDKGYLTPAIAKRLLATEEEVSTARMADAVEEITLLPDEPKAAPPAKASASRTTPIRETPPVAKTAEFVAADESPMLMMDDDAEMLDLGMPTQPAGLKKPTYDTLKPVSGMEAAPVEPPTTEKGKKKGFFGIGKRGQKPTKKEDWGSVFMLVGGGSLIVLVLAGILLTWYLYRQGIANKYVEAQDFYKGASYEQAKHSFDEFAKTFPSDPNASTARVMIGLAEMRAEEAGQDWPQCLETATAVLERISHEDNFSEANGELAAMLPKIAEGLALKAKEKSSSELVGKTRKSLELMEKYVPKSLSSPAKVAEIEASLALTERKIERDKALEKAVAELKQAIKEQKTIEAYSIRRLLLKKYPDLLDDAKLAATMLEISQAQFAAVKTVKDGEAQASSTEETPTSILATVAIAQRSTKTVLEELQGRVICVPAEGAIYGIDASSGKVLWRRYVGYPKDTQHLAAPPVPVSAEAGADVIAVDLTQSEILRLEAASGKLLWRFPVGEAFVPQPVIAEGRLLVATEAGKVLVLDAETGMSQGHVLLPQALHVAPAFDPAKKLIYQIADHSNLYVVGMDDLACKQVYLLGHETGSIASPPAVLSGFLAIGINDGARDSTLRLFSVSRGSADKPGTAVKQINQHSLVGRIDITPSVDGNRILVATDRGIVRIFELASSNKETLLRDVAETAIEGDNVARFALLQGGMFWIADVQLTKFDVVQAKGRLVPKWVQDEQCAFLQAPYVAGNAVIAVRKRPGLPGVFVSALVGVDDPARAWETVLAAPPVGDMIVQQEAKQLTAVTQLGGLYEIEEGKIQGQGVLDVPTVAMEATRLPAPMGSVAALGKNMLAIAPESGATQINVFEPSDKTRYGWLVLSEKSACPPIGLGGGLVAPVQSGAIFLLDPQTGKPLAAPFMARVDSGVKPAWQKPAPCGKQEFVIADGKATLYRIGRVDSPKPHLAALDQIEIASDGLSPVAVLGNLAFVAGSGGSLEIIELPKFKRLNEVKLSGHCAWGPAEIGERILLATDDEQLVCIDAKGEKLWQVPLAYGKLAGSPHATSEGFICASVSGIVWRIDGKTGQEIGKVEIGRTLGSGAVKLGERMFVLGSDGSIYEVKQP
jgi:outer membrane protein assembly factor BamB/TolA-binding protein/predicted nucleic acid-binding protein